MKIGDEIFVHGYVDEIRKDTVIVRNNGGYFGTDESEIVIADNHRGIIRCKNCKYYRSEIDMCDEPYSTAHNIVHEDDYCSKAERKEE